MINEFTTADAQISAMAEVIIEALNDGIVERGRGCLAVSGGNSPKPLYQALAQSDLDWEKIDIVMVDDRFVPLGHKASNETMIRENLLVGEAEKATFWPLYAEGELAAVANQRAQEWKDLPSPDCAVMGMGSDGHTASWFPDADGLDNALAPTSNVVVPVIAKKSEVTGDFLERLTVSYGYLRDCPVRLLLMSGAEKRAVFETACGDGAINDMPIRALIRDMHSITAYWTE